MEDAYNSWKKSPSPQTMGSLLDKADPVISSAIMSYAGGNSAFRGHARAMAAKAFESYDPKKGTKLRTHLLTQLQPLTRMAREHSQATKVPERISLDLYRINQEHQKFFDQHGREASEKEMADITGLSTRRIAHVRKYARPDKAESGLTAVSDEGDNEIYYPGVEQADPQKVWLEYVHHDLNPIDQKILEWKSGIYGKELLSTNEIAKRLGITPGAVSQRAAKISARLAEGREIVE